MDTEVLQIFDPVYDHRAVDRAAALLSAGKLVAIPTETVYGLAANGLSREAVAGIYRAKGRPSDNPLILHVDDERMMRPLVAEIPDAARRLIDAFWPGALTLVLKKTDLVPENVSGGLSTVAVRCPDHPVAQAIIHKAGVPLAAPSANLSGKPSPTSFSHVWEDLHGRVDAIVKSHDCGIGVESTVVTVLGGCPRVLRPGGVSLEALRRVIPGMALDDAVLSALGEGVSPSSPGMKYQHYAPKAAVVLVVGDGASYRRYVNDHAGPGVMALCFTGEERGLCVPCVTYGEPGDEDAQAREIFGALRALDERGAAVAYAHCPEKAGKGLAVYNRLLRAAGFTVVQL